jgi:hypothetical protein
MDLAAKADTGKFRFCVPEYSSHGTDIFQAWPATEWEIAAGGSADTYTLFVGTMY